VDCGGDVLLHSPGSGYCRTDGLVRMSHLPHR
jgi:hypothetical protein